MVARMSRGTDAKLTVGRIDKTGVGNVFVGGAEGVFDGLRGTALGTGRPGSGVVLDRQIVGGGLRQAGRSRTVRPCLRQLRNIRIRHILGGHIRAAFITAFRAVIFIDPEDGSFRKSGKILPRVPGLRIGFANSDVRCLRIFHVKFGVVRKMAFLVRNKTVFTHRKPDRFHVRRKAFRSRGFCKFPFSGNQSFDLDQAVPGSAFANGQSFGRGGRMVGSFPADRRIVRDSVRSVGEAELRARQRHAGDISLPDDKMVRFIHELKDEIRLFRALCRNRDIPGSTVPYISGGGGFFHDPVAPFIFLRVEEFRDISRRGVDKFFAVPADRDRRAGSDIVIHAAVPLADRKCGSRRKAVQSFFNRGIRQEFCDVQVYIRIVRDPDFRIRSAVFFRQKEET